MSLSKHPWSLVDCGAKKRLVNAQNAAGSVLRQLKNLAPQAGDVQIVWMEPDNHQVGLLPAQKLNDCVYRLTFDQVILDFDAVNLHLDACFFLKFLVQPQSILLQLSRQRRIGDCGKRRIRRKGINSGDRMQVRMQAGRQPDSRLQRPLGLGRFVIRCDNPMKHATSGPYSSPGSWEHRSAKLLAARLTARRSSSPLNGSAITSWPPISSTPDQSLKLAFWA